MARVTPLDFARAVEDVEASLARIARATLRGGTARERTIAARQYRTARAHLLTLATTVRQQQKEQRHGS